MTIERITIDDDDGFPVMLAQAPGQVAPQAPPSGVVIRRGAVSGNPNADPANGRFTGNKGKRVTNSKLQQDVTGPAAATTRSGVPQGVTVEQWEKRLDLVRDAARQMEEMTGEDASDFLTGKVSDLAAVDIDAFLIDVRAQRLDDLADVLNHQLHAKVDGSRTANKKVHVVAPAGWSDRVFAGLNDEEAVKLLVRVQGKGWRPADLKKHIISKINNEERKTKIEQLFGENTPEQTEKEK